ncbi:acyltransferase [Alteromonadaceae bacterium BrNp21-10]|nr:acyltransferase [Alteromonadaceae bacterium BrNp21-10]
MSQHWSSIAERGNQFGIQCLLFLYRIFGKTLLKIVLLPVIIYFFITGSTSRRYSKIFLTNAFKLRHSKGLSTQSRPSIYDGIKHFMSFGLSAFDKIDSWLGNISPNQITYKNYALFNHLIEQKRGAIFIGSHLGNLEVCRALGQGKYAIRINVLVFTQHAEAFNKVLGQLNDDADLNLIQVTQVGPDVAIMLKDRVDKGEFVVIVGDRTPINNPGRVSTVDFMGKPAPFSQGPLILASVLECPVYLLFCLREKRGFKVIFENFAIPKLVLPRKNRQEILSTYCQKFAHRLEHYACLYPHQWYNFFDFWQQDITSVAKENEVK